MSRLDDESLNDRLERLERLVEELSRRVPPLPADAAAAPRPLAAAVVPTELPRGRTRIRQSVADRAREWMPDDGDSPFAWDGQTWLNRLGIVLLLLGVALLFRYSIDMGWLTPGVRVGFGAAVPYFFRGERGRYARDLLVAVAGARRKQAGLWKACPSARLTTMPSSGTGTITPPRPTMRRSAVSDAGDDRVGDRLAGRVVDVAGRRTSAAARVGGQVAVEQGDDGGTVDPLVEEQDPPPSSRRHRLLDEGDGETELRRAERARVAAAPTSEDDDVVPIGHFALETRPEARHFLRTAFPSLP